jgi:SNF2 family DNA or RNA helicase
LKSIGESPKAISKAAKKGRDTLGFVPRIEIRSEWLEEFDKGKALLPRSAKVEAIRDKLRTWKNEAPSDKVIIFVQWSLMIRLIGIMLEEERVSFIYYVVSLS